MSKKEIGILDLSLRDTLEVLGQIYTTLAVVVFTGMWFGLLLAEIL